MGYNVQKTIKNISFVDGHQFAGLEIKSHTVSIKEWTAIARLFLQVSKALKETVSNDDEAVKAMDDIVDSLDVLVGKFVEKLISWNLELEDQKVEPNLEGISKLDDTLVLELIQAWMDGIGGTPDPLEPGLTNGETFPDLPIRMEVKYPNLVS